MRRLHLKVLSTVSVAALAALALPGTAMAQGTTEERPACDTGTQAERDACVAARGEDEPIVNSGDAATLPADVATSRESDEAIVVTGSRIRRSEFNSPDPITVIDPNLGLRQGQITTTELVNSSPIAAGSVQITSVISNNFVTNGGAGAETVSLRGLGAERTLVLLNGRRAGPAGVRGAVTSFDLNVIPSAIIRSVEILKTGASSIYGSDAVAGVVNIFTKRATDGIELRAFGSMPFERGGETYDLSASYGKDFGRFHFIVTGDYFRRQDLQRNQRDFLGCQEEFLTFTGVRAGERADIVDPRTGKPACNGTIGNLFIFSGLDFTGRNFGPGLFAPNGQAIFLGQYAVGSELNGVGIPLNGFVGRNQNFPPKIVTPANFFGMNFDGPSTGALNQYLPLEQNSDVISDLEKYTFFATAGFEITPSIEAYTELLYNKRKTHNDGFQQLNVIQFTGNSLLPQLGLCDPSPGGDFNCRTTDAGDPFNNEFQGNFLLRPLILTESDFDTDIDYYRGVLGVKGDFGGGLSGWSWDVYGQYSRSEGAYTQDVIFDDAIYTQNFRTRSCVGRTTPVRGVPCIDIDFTDPRVVAGDFNEQERAFLFGRETGHTIYQQTTGEATLTGNLLTLPAGPVGVAVGAQARRDEIEDTPGEHTLASNIAFRTASGITAGHTLSKEAFGEISIPLIHDTPLIQSFTVTGAARYTRVDATRRDGVKDDFSHTTWKVGADWHVADFLRFRGSWGTSFRAPALFELFLENQTGFQRQQDIDICINYAAALVRGAINERIAANCAAAGIPGDFAGATGSALVTSGGGIGNLRPETSTAKVASIILTPDTSGILWGGMRVSLVLDYFDIKVKNEITTLGARNIIIACYNSDFFPNDPICNQITRAPAGATDALNVRAIRDTFINVNNQENRGIDATVRVVQDLHKWGSLNLLGQMTWQLDDKTALFEGTVVTDNGEAGEPKWVGNFNLTWDKGPWSVFYGLNVIGGTNNRARYIRTNGANLLCRTSAFRPGVDPVAAARGERVQFCPDLRLSPTFYHSISVTRELGERFTITAGISNLLDRRPPRASTVFAGISAIGQAPVFGSQYDYLGRRAFLNLRAKF